MVAPALGGQVAAYTPVTARQIAAARRDARHLNIGWVIVWHSNQAVREYLAKTGFRLSYTADKVSVYQPVAP